VTVTIPAGQASATFTITALDHFLPDVNRLVTVVAGAGGFASGSATIGADGVNHVVQYNPPVPAVLGDVTKPRPQGEVILAGNQISNSGHDGILAEGVAYASGSPTIPYPGGIVNTPQQQQPGSGAADLAAGVVIQNNLIYGVATTGAGIELDGTNDGAGGVPAAVPFGRIVNNTIYGQDIGGAGTGSGQGTGILIGANSAPASPTILNNVLVNLQTGIDDADGPGTVTGENLYQNDGLKSNVPGSEPFALTATGPASVTFRNPSTNPSTANFYLTDNSVAIDSSINSLQDRTSMTLITGPIGVPPSPILAPAYDLYGQLRVADPNVTPPISGLGYTPYIDRGAVEHAAATGPTASLLAPNPSGADNLSSAPNTVFIRGESLTEFSIQLSDGSGPGLYDNSVLPYDYAQIAPSATGASIVGETIAVTVVGGATMKFEFTTSTLPGGDTNVPIVVLSTDTAATLAADAAATISGATGFATPNLAVAVGPRIRLQPGDTVAVTGGQLTAGAANTLDVVRDGKRLTAGVDYFFNYDNNNHIIHLVAASGVWLNGHQYDIYLDNGDKFDPYNLS
ncbi:MAG: hypothetical protein B7Z73_15245, partial [Planctomycetia bacterium 21-64-5]